MKKTFTLLAFTAISLSLQAQSQTKIIKLTSQRLNYRPSNFHISSIIDEREDTTRLGTMRAGLRNKVVNINLQYGTAAGLQKFLKDNNTQDLSKTPVAIHLKRLDISESATMMAEQATLNGEIEFHANGRKLYEVTYNSYAQSGLDVSMYIGKLINQFTEYILKDFDKVVSQNKGLLGKAKIKITPVLGNDLNDVDLIEYDNKLPLSKEDFKATPDDLSIATAATYSGTSIKYYTETFGNEHNIRVVITPYFDMSRSWWRVTKNSKEVLSHEQLHFDITALHAYELAEEIKNYPFNSDNFETEIEALHKQAEKNRDLMQQQYDKETKHGQLKPKQAEWEKMIRHNLSVKKI